MAAGEGCPTAIRHVAAKIHSTMIDILYDASPLALATAVEANQHAHAYLYSHLPDTTLWDEPDLLGLLTGLDPSESFMYRTLFSPEDAEQRIEKVHQRFQSLSCLPMFWQVGPTTLPVDLGKFLLSQGFTFFIRVPGMSIDLREMDTRYTTQGNLAIIAVETNDHLRAWVEIVSKTDGISDALQKGFFQVFASQEFGISPDCQLFLGVENGRPVATSRLFCKAGVAGIWHVATLPEARGKGY